MRSASRFRCSGLLGGEGRCGSAFGLGLNPGQSLGFGAGLDGGLSFGFGLGRSLSGTQCFRLRRILSGAQGVGLRRSRALGFDALDFRLSGGRTLHLGGCSHTFELGLTLCKIGSGARSGSLLFGGRFGLGQALGFGFVARRAALSARGLPQRGLPAPKPGAPAEQQAHAQAGQQPNQELVHGGVIRPSESAPSIGGNDADAGAWAGSVKAHISRTARIRSRRNSVYRRPTRAGRAQARDVACRAAPELSARCQPAQAVLRPAGHRGTGPPPSAPAPRGRAHPSGFIQVNIQLIMPKSSMVIGVVSAACFSSGRSAPTTVAKPATTSRSLSRMR